ncbi:S41 family peptidase [Neobacillus sp. PS3-34]|uniref:S41 family peptidase n=1 Tax=Neobacillus sp. PS3-34 TaxID=3070678 RepID=UPI0027E12FF3|nr:S41 family peptidase [Neobacillus sp. PS3-34]WML46729.1 S41 family peptidase [Neobacillus sp. PS3-34]
MKFISYLFALLLLLTPLPAAAAADTTTTASSQNPSAVQDSSILQEIKNKLKENYYKPLTDSSLNATTIDELIASLNDPYTEYMNPDEFKSFMSAIDQNFVGLGIGIEKAKDGVLITTVYKNTPASRMGLQNGDIIIKVDSHDISNSPMEEVQSYMLGKENTKVTLTVRRGNKELTLTGTRATIHLPLVEGKLLDGSVGYISISSFGTDTYKEFVENLTSLKNQHAKKWIIDLRGNGGGQVVASLQIMEHFIKATDKPVIKFVYGNGDVDQIGSGGSDLHLDSAIVLTDEYTASASEILAYTLKNNHAALLMGRKTYGKGVMQEADTLSDGSYLKYTIAEIKSANNVSYNKIGIQPNIDLKDIAMASKQHTDQWLTIARLYQQGKTGPLSQTTSELILQIIKSSSFLTIQLYHQN